MRGDSKYSMTWQEPVLPTAIARRIDYLADALFAGKFDANPRYR